MNTYDGSIPPVRMEQFSVFTAEKMGVYIRSKVTEFPGLADSVKLELLKGPLDGMIAQIRGWLVAGRIPDNSMSKTVLWPDGVWQMFKHKFLPGWFKNKFPVRWHKETFEVVTNHYFVCPHLVTDPQGMHVKFMATGTNIASMMHPEDRRW